MANTPKYKRLDKTQADLPVSNQKFYCCRCGTAYSRQKGYFPVSHSPMYRGTGYLPMCSECVDDLYEAYRAKLKDDKEAMRRVCMKMDLYWNESIYEGVLRSAGVNSRIRNYIAKTNVLKYVDKSFDDTLEAEEKHGRQPAVPEPVQEEAPAEPEPEPVIDVPQDIIDFWGPGFTPSMYLELNDRYQYWVKELPQGVALDVGTKALLRQICNSELEINRLRAKGESIDKAVGTLNQLLGSALLKPSQQKDDSDANLDKIPYGVWIKRLEDHRPVSDPDPEMKDVDGIVRYIDTWFRGHTAKMLGLKTAASALYEKAIERLRIDRPDLEDEDDEDLIADIFGEDDPPEDEEDDWD